MTTATATRAGAGILVPGSERNLGTTIESIRNAWTKHRAYRSTLAELRDLSDRQLNDIGTSRDQLKRFAREAIYNN